MSDETLTDLQDQARRALLRRIAELAPRANSTNVQNLAEAYASIISPSRSAVSLTATANR